MCGGGSTDDPSARNKKETLVLRVLRPDGPCPPIIGLRSGIILHDGGALRGSEMVEGQRISKAEKTYVKGTWGREHCNDPTPAGGRNTIFL